MAKKLALLITMGIAVATTAFVLPAFHINIQIEQAQKYFAAGEYDRAEEALQRITDLDPWNEDARLLYSHIRSEYLYLCASLEKQYEYHKAIEVLNKAQKIQHTNTVVTKLMELQIKAKKVHLTVDGEAVSAGLTRGDSSLYIDAKDSVVTFQSHPVRVKLYVPENLVDLKVGIYKNNTVLLKSSFFLLEGGYGYSVLYTILGIPSFFKPGEYVMKGTGTSEEGNYVEVSIPVSIKDVEFPSEEIRLNPVLTNIIVEPDPRKTEEYYELIGVLRTINSQNLYNPGSLVMPIEEGARPTSVYGEERRYIYSNGSDSLDTHKGADFGAPVGTPVLSMGKGRVVLAKERIVTGNTLVIEHAPGVYSMYYHMSKLRVEQNSTVFPGDHIGDVGNTGLSTAAHLHFEVRVSGDAVDPYYFMDKEIVF